MCCICIFYSLYFLHDLEIAGLTERQKAELKVKALKMLMFSLGVTGIYRSENEHIC